MPTFHSSCTTNKVLCKKQVKFILFNKIVSISVSHPKIKPRSHAGCSLGLQVRVPIPSPSTSHPALLKNSPDIPLTISRAYFRENYHRSLDQTTVVLWSKVRWYFRVNYRGTFQKRTVVFFSKARPCSASGRNHSVIYKKMLDKILSAL